MTLYLNNTSLHEYLISLLILVYKSEKSKPFQNV